MIKVDQFMDVRQLHKQGLSIRAIARATELSRNTVRKVLRGEHDLKFDTPDRASKLDPYKPFVHKRFEEYGLSAVRLIEEIRPMGYDGSVYTIRRFIQRLRQDQAHQAKTTVRFETAPGLQAQADWAFCGRHAQSDGRMIKVYVFAMVLGFSRMLFMRFTTSMKMPVLIECHREAFEFFGAVPHTILYDNMKQIRLGPDRLNEQFVDFANHYGFIIDTHRPYRPRTKGKVERPIHYIRGNFLAGRSFIGLDNVNACGLHWLEHTANVRVHGTTGHRPIDLFEQDRAAMLPISSIRPYRLADPMTRIVSHESMVQVHGSRYSVPPKHAGQKVQVMADAGQIVIRDGDTVIAEHPAATRKGMTIARREHIAEVWKITAQQTRPPVDLPRWHLSFEPEVATVPLRKFEEVVA